MDTWAFTPPLIGSLIKDSCRHFLFSVDDLQSFNSPGRGLEEGRRREDEAGRVAVCVRVFVREAAVGNPEMNYGWSGRKEGREGG